MHSRVATGAVSLWSATDCFEAPFVMGRWIMLWDMVIMSNNLGRTTCKDAITICYNIGRSCYGNNSKQSSTFGPWFVLAFFFAAGLMMSGWFQPPLQLHEFPLCEQEFTWLASISLRGKPSLIFNHSISTFAKTYLFECIFWYDICHWNGWYTVSTVPSKHLIAHNAYPG